MFKDFDMSERKFPHAYEVATPKGAEGWETMYPQFYTFSREPGSKRDWESSLFWFQDGMHHGEPLYPLDAIHPMAWQWALSSYNSRTFVVPPALGIAHRVLNCYLYITPIPVLDPKEVERRVGYFMKRAGYYYQNWNKIFDEWKVNAEKIVKEMEGLEFRDLPEFEDEEVVFKHMGLSKSSYTLYENYHKLVLLHFRLWQKHFEMLNLGYAAYLTFYMFCKEKFPGIPDQHIARMVAGIESILFRPDQECRRLAREALKLGISDIFLRRLGYERTVEELRKVENGMKWLAELEKSKYPWFYYATGPGFFHTEPRWIDNPDIPLGFITDYIEKLMRNEDIELPTEKLRREREELAQRYKSLLKDPQDIKTFEENLQLARTVFPYVEDHNFYVEHWGHTIWYKKIREIGSILVNHGIIRNVEDIFYLNWFELSQVLYDVCANWAVGVEPAGKYYWPAEVERRRKIIETCRQNRPPPALGKPPEVITEPFTIMLWGVTKDRIEQWLSGAVQKAVNKLSGLPASPGVAEGRARVVLSAEEIVKVKEGEILVAPITAPAWNPVFTKIKATVTDIGGIMSHTAIVCREYGLPAVVGTGFATQVIKDGMRLRVDGNEGVVEILEG
jgi:pyruvate,water dikinase